MLPPWPFWGLAFTIWSKNPKPQISYVRQPYPWTIWGKVIGNDHHTGKKKILISFYKGLHLFCTRSVRMRNGFGEIDNGLASLLVFVKYQSRRSSSGTNSNLQDLMEKCSDNMKQLKSKHLEPQKLSFCRFLFISFFLSFFCHIYYFQENLLHLLMHYNSSQK